MKFYPYEKGGGKSLSHAERGVQKNFWGSLTTVLAILKGDAQQVSTL